MGVFVGADKRINQFFKIDDFVCQSDLVAVKLIDLTAALNNCIHVVHTLLSQSGEGLLDRRSFNE